MSRVIQGALLTQPQAVAFVDDSALGEPPIGGAGTLVIIGESFGGPPMTPLFFRSPSNAHRLLRNGDLDAAVQRAFMPGPSLQGAPRVVAIRANKGTQSTLDLRDGTDPSLDTPGRPTLTAHDTGGTLEQASGPFQYRIVARDSHGSTLPGLAAASSVAVTSNLSTVDVAWVAVPGAASYDVYGRAPDAEQFMTNVTGTTFTDDGSIVPDGDLPIEDTTGSPRVMTVFSTDFGAWTNGIRIKIEDGAGGLGKHITVQLDSIINTRQQVFRKGLQLRLLDMAADFSSVTAHVTPSTFVLHFVPTVGDASTSTLQLGSYATLQALAEAINNLGLGVESAVASPAPAIDPSIFLDEMEDAVEIRVISDNDAGPVLWENHQAVLEFLQRQAGIVTAAVNSGDSRRPPVNTSGWVYLGSDEEWHEGTDFGRDVFGVKQETSFVQDWSDAFDAALAIDCSIITVATPDETLQGMLESHVQQASSIQGRHERVAIIGGDNGETVSYVQGRAERMRDPRMMLCYPGAVDRDPVRPFTGDQIIIPPYLLASQLAGMFCSQAPAEALTHKYIRANGLERKLTSDEIDMLLEWGVAPLEVVQNRGFRVVQSRSTWIADQNYRWNEISVMRASDEIIKRIRGEADDRLVGRIVGPELLAQAVSLADSVLRHCQADNLIVGRPAYRNIIATANGDLVTIDFEASIAIPANFIAITAHFTPFVGVLTQA